jgi:hypothetical protein
LLQIEVVTAKSEFLKICEIRACRERLRVAGQVRPGNLRALTRISRQKIDLYGSSRTYLLAMRGAKNLVNVPAEKGFAGFPGYVIRRIARSRPGGGRVRRGRGKNSR